MGGRNEGICHGCRKPGHYLLDCPTKKTCLVCGKGMEKCMEVERRTANYGRMFFCCTNNCRHFKWLDKDEYHKFQGESSATSEIHELSGLLKHVAKITEENNVEVDVRFSFPKGKGEKDAGKAP